MQTFLLTYMWTTTQMIKLKQYQINSSRYHVRLKQNTAVFDVQLRNQRGVALRRFVVVFQRLRTRFSHFPARFLTLASI